MHRSGRILIIAATLAGCGSPVGPAEVPEVAFGTIAAVVDGRPWVSTPNNGEFVASYDGSLERLTIQGVRVQPGRGPAIRIMVLGPLETGRHRLDGQPLAGQWFTTGPRRQFQAYVTTGVPGDAVVVDEIDLQQGTIRGTFTMTPRLLDGVTSIRIRGAFAGRLWVTP